MNLLIIYFSYISTEVTYDVNIFTSTLVISQSLKHIPNDNPQELLDTACIKLQFQLSIYYCFVSLLAALVLRPFNMLAAFSITITNLCCFSSLSKQFLQMVFGSGSAREICNFDFYCAVAVISCYYFTLVRKKYSTYVYGEISTDFF